MSVLCVVALVAIGSPGLAWPSVVETRTLALWPGTAVVVTLDEPKPTLDQHYTVQSLPFAGSLFHGSRRLAQGDSITASSLAQSPLIYRHHAVGQHVADHFALVSTDPAKAQATSLIEVQVALNQPPIASLDGLKLWLDAARGDDVQSANGSAVAVGEDVAAWTDRSPLGLDATQTDPAHTPTRVGQADARGDLTAIRFSGGGQSLVSPVTLAQDWQHEGYTYLAAFRAEGSTAGLEAVVSSNGARSGLYVSKNNVLARGFASTHQGGWLSDPIQFDQWIVATARYEPAASFAAELFVDGTLRSARPYLPELLNLSGTRIGDSRSSVDEALHGDLGEVVIINRALTTNERRRVEAYLLSKWSTLVIHDRTAAVGNETLSAGSSMPAMILAGSGDDLVEGSDYNDQLSGGPGSDTLRGGTGADRFIFDHADGALDTVEDYVAGEGDVLDLSGLFGAQADRGFDDYIEIESRGPDTWIGIDVDGARGFRTPDLSIVIKSVRGLTSADVVTGIETDTSGLESIELQLSGHELGTPLRLELGKPAKLRLIGHYQSGETREIVHPGIDLSLSAPLGTVDQHRVLVPHEPGIMQIQATLGALTTTLDNVVVANLTRLGFREIERQDMGLSSSVVYQGVEVTLDYVFTGANFPYSLVKNLHVSTVKGVTGLQSRVYKLTRDYKVDSFGVIAPPDFGTHHHIGALAMYEGYLYATFMDVESLNDPIAPNKVGVAKIDPETLLMVDYYNLSGTLHHLDGIAFSKGYMWLPTTPSQLTRLPMTEQGPDVARIVRYSYDAGIGALQGLRIRDGLLYAVPEYTTSIRESMGIAVFEMDRLVPDPQFNMPLPIRDHVKRVNLPDRVYPLRYPYNKPYHESFDFDPEDPDLIYIPFNPGGDELIKIRLDHKPGEPGARRKPNAGPGSRRLPGDQERGRGFVEPSRSGML